MTTETSNARGEWVLVPREPTAEMVQASDEISCRAEGAEHWAAMLAAAPPPPAEAQAQGGGESAAWKALGAVESELGPLVGMVHDPDNPIHRALEAAMAALNQRDTAPPSAPVGVEALRAEQAAAVMPLIGPLLDAWERVHPDDSVHDSGIAKYIEPINRAMEDGIAPSAPYSIDADADGIRARVADAITGALAFGAQGAHKPPAGHWLEPFWDMARAEREAPSPPTVGEATARRLDDYLGGEFDIRIGKQAAHAALVHALAQQPAASAVALTVCCGREECGGECGNEWRGMEWVRIDQQPAAVDEAMVERAWVAFCESAGSARQGIRAALTAALATQHQEPTHDRRD